MKWVGTDGDFFYGRPYGPPDVLVIHTMAGFLTGTDSTFNDPNRDASTHYGISLDGRIHQYVRLEDCAWGNGVLEAGERWTGHYGRPGVSPNYRTVSIETEDKGSGATPVSDALYAATLALAKHVILPRYPSITSVSGHRVISPRSRDQCPGNRWVQSGRLASLAQELGLELFI